MFRNRHGNVPVEVSPAKEAGWETERNLQRGPLSARARQPISKLFFCGSIPRSHGKRAPPQCKGRSFPDLGTPRQVINGVGQALTYRRRMNKGRRSRISWQIIYAKLGFWMVDVIDVDVLRSPGNR